MNSKQKVMVDGVEFDVKSVNDSEDVIANICDDVIETMTDIGMDDEELATAKEVKEKILKGRNVFVKSAKGGNKIADRLNEFFEGKRGITQRYPNGK